MSDLLDTSEGRRPLTLEEEKEKTREEVKRIQEELKLRTPEQQAEERAKFQKFDRKQAFGQTKQPEGTGATKPAEKPLSLLQRRSQQGKGNPK